MVYDLISKSRLMLPQLFPDVGRANPEFESCNYSSGAIQIFVHTH